MMNNYETVFILTPDLSADQTKETVEKFISLITDNGGELVNREEWGMRKLAYPIQAKSTGFYVFLEFKSVPSFIETLEVNYRRDDKVIRFLTFKQEKFALEYAEKRRRNRKESVVTEAEEVEVEATTVAEENE